MRRCHYSECQSATLRKEAESGVIGAEIWPSALDIGDDVLQLEVEVRRPGVIGSEAVGVDQRGPAQARATVSRVGAVRKQTEGLD